MSKPETVLELRKSLKLKMNISHEGKVEISNEAYEMLESLPQKIAISVMISLAVNLIRATKGELKAKLPDDPVLLIAEIAAMIALNARVKKAEKISSPKTVDKAKVH